MTYLVQKFGGTSVANTELIKKAALRVKAEVERGHRVVVVVSAMAGVTNQLVNNVHEISSNYDRAEYDAVLSSGEQVTAGLLAMALRQLGLSARSWMGWQIPIYTQGAHANATIDRVETSSLKKSLDKGVIAVVAGFQGISSDGRIATLGRGGSDTTAVALAAALKAERCDIYTDVDGVYTADPRMVSSAGKLDQIAYKDMLELSSQGAKVLQRESVDYAMRQKVKLRVLSSLSDASGTFIVEHNERPQEISGVAHSFNDTQILLKNLPFGKDTRSKIQKIIHIPFDMFQEVIHDECVQCTFTIPTCEWEQVNKALLLKQEDLEFHSIERNDKVAKISIVGTGVQEHSYVAHKLFRTLAEENIHVDSVCASDIKLSVLIKKEDAEKALSLLHSAYLLDVRS